ncbi:MAG: aldo/keto reductase [Clostridia bacterium]|nr:aldo/keto reductase [Clostridia bacterium]MBQ3077313.1 aldo/keto reductase [Clostridia bacterium]
MEYRKLGATGLSVSTIALGCAYFEKAEREHFLSVMDYAVEKGVNFLDLYCADPVTRDNYGAALKGRREKFVIQGHVGSAWVDEQYLRTRDLTLAKPSFEDLLTRLGTDYLDVGMIHYCDSEADWKEITEGGFLDWCLELKKEGRIRHIGLSSHNPDIAIKAVETGHIEVLMFSVNPCYDMQPGDEDLEKLWAADSYAGELHNQNADRKRLYELCESRGVGIDVMKAYGGGDLLSEELSPFGKAFTPVQCLHYCLTRPAVSAIMCGVKDIAQLDEALAWLTATEEQRDYSGVLSGLDRFTFSGHCLYCGHCAPCPVGIDVASVTKYLNLCLAQGTVPTTERSHYELLAHHGGECIGCGACESRCPFGVSIMENMKKAAEVFGK